MRKQIFSIIPLLIVALAFQTCRSKNTFHYTYNESVPDTIEEAFIKQYSSGLEQYKWKINHNTFDVYFIFQNDTKIATYDSNAILVKMQTQVALEDQFLNYFKKSIQVGKDLEVINCFLVVKRDSIYHRVYYKDQKGYHTINLFVPDVPEL